MLPFRHRVSVVLWVLWLVWCIPVVFTLVEPYATAKSETYSSSYSQPAIAEDSSLHSSASAGNLEDQLAAYYSSQSQFSSIVSVSDVEAYKLGRMAEQKRFKFESDLRLGKISLPSGMSVVVPAHYPEFYGTLVNFSMLIFLPGLGVALIQFLFVGFASPFQLLGSRKANER